MSITKEEEIKIILNEIEYVKQIIELIPPDEVITLLSFQSRIGKLKSEIEEIEYQINQDKTST